MRTWLQAQADAWIITIIALSVLAALVAVAVAAFHPRHGSFAKGAGVAVGAVVIIAFMISIRYFVGLAQEDLGTGGGTVEEVGG